MTGDQELLAIATRVALEAGQLAARLRVEGVEVAASKSSPQDVVTHADRETETRIRELLAEARPDDGFLGEESGSGVGRSGLTWVVDPIDGTVNYLYGLRHYAVSIAVVEGEPKPESWRARVGVVFNPAVGELFDATAGGGARLDSRPIAVAPPVPLDSALVGTGFGYVAEVREQQARMIQGIIGSVRDIRRQGTASLDLCSVASGRLNAYYEQGLKEWDFAAGALIAQEAGACVTGWAGAPASENMLLAAHPDVAAALVAVLGEHRE